jgi:hypothetical protein
MVADKGMAPANSGVPVGARPQAFSEKGVKFVSVS